MNETKSFKHKKVLKYVELLLNSIALPYNHNSLFCLPGLVYNVYLGYVEYREYMKYMKYIEYVEYLEYIVLVEKTEKLKKGGFET